MKILNIREHFEMAVRVAEWFHSKWNIPKEAYQESIDACLQNRSGVPQWYVVVEHDTIISGAGVIENDFHDRKDLTPNVCALYVEHEYRQKGIAGKLLQHICDDMAYFGTGTLYLITDHTSFYERYGWTFLCMVREEGGADLTRMYVHQMPPEPPYPIMESKKTRVPV